MAAYKNACVNLGASPYEGIEGNELHAHRRRRSPDHRTLAVQVHIMREDKHEVIGNFDILRKLKASAAGGDIYHSAIDQFLTAFNSYSRPHVNDASAFASVIDTPRRALAGQVHG